MVVSDLAKKVKKVSTHSRLKAAVGKTNLGLRRKMVSTHSRLKAAVAHIRQGFIVVSVFQHTAA